MNGVPAQLVGLGPEGRIVMVLDCGVPDVFVNVPLMVLPDSVADPVRFGFAVCDVIANVVPVTPFEVERLILNGVALQTDVIAGDALPTGTGLPVIVSV